MARKPVVLLLESDVTRRRMMTYNLEVEGFEVLAAESEDDVVARLMQDEIDLALVNWEGFDSGILAICQHFKASGKYVPVLVIAGPEGEEERLAAFRAGVDDIMPKPFSVPELLARIRAILRRTSPDLGGRVIRVSGLNLDVNNGRVSRDGKDIRLSQTEFRILRYLMEHAGKVRTREQIRNAVWGQHGLVEIRAIDVRITRLRRQLHVGSGSDLIRTVRSVGYLFSEEQPRYRAERAISDEVA